MNGISPGCEIDILMHIKATTSLSLIPTSQSQQTSHLCGSPTLVGLRYRFKVISL
ncbi:uncharacterized protein RSE6_06704 [Rhynchosporium secalis]|uniref:Uncharacterized protein n=1 Tax=Rhynchosporium secalis TaxID=38038 RepID=A0A1E1MC11_RHYSE|nr:uncharacterized protein RSE6_06704 [Rhynchosporium secalis]